MAVIKEKKKTKNKLIMGILFIGIGILIFSGAMFAYFSDVLFGEAVVTAGTLDLQGEFVAFLNDDPTPITPVDGVVTVTNFNPGDCITFIGQAVNMGTKSAWIRAGVSFDLVDHGIEDYIYILPYDPTEEEPTCSDVRGMSSAELSEAALNDSGIEAPSFYGDEKLYILDGTVEQESALTQEVTVTGDYEYLGSNSASFGYVIYFDKWATNEAQGKKIKFSALIEALQFRNNPDPNGPGPNGTGTVWDTVVSKPYCEVEDIPSVDSNCLTYIVEDYGAVITGYRCYEGNPYDMPTITDVVIPSKLGGSDVVEIITAGDDGGFREKGLTS